MWPRCASAVASSATRICTPITSAGSAAKSWRVASACAPTAPCTMWRGTWKRARNEVSWALARLVWALFQCRAPKTHPVVRHRIIWRFKRALGRGSKTGTESGQLYGSFSEVWTNIYMLCLAGGSRPIIILRNYFYSSRLCKHILQYFKTI